MNIQSLQAVVGLVVTQGTQGIIDRIGESIIATFRDVEMETGLKGFKSDDNLV